MKLLALDTSSEGCSAALWLDGRVIERFEVAPPRGGHTRLLMPMVRELCAEQGLSPPIDLDALAFARGGPGSFTGLRIATGVVQGLAWGGLDIPPVVPVSSLAAVALAAIETHALQEGDCIAVAFDARMGGEVYWGGVFRCEAGGLPVLLSEERVCPPDAVTLPTDAGGNWYGAGQGWTLKEQMPVSSLNASQPLTIRCCRQRPRWRNWPNRECRTGRRCQQSRHNRCISGTKWPGRSCPVGSEPPRSNRRLCILHQILHNAMTTLNPHPPDGAL